MCKSAIIIYVIRKGNFMEDMCKVFYESESINANFLLGWVARHEFELMDSDECLTLSQISSLIVALSDYRDKCEKYFQE